MSTLVLFTKYDMISTLDSAIGSTIYVSVRGIYLLMALFIHLENDKRHSSRLVNVYRLYRTEYKINFEGLGKLVKID